MSTLVPPPLLGTRRAAGEATGPTLDRFESARASLSLASTLRPAHWIIVALSVAITLAAWYTAQVSLESRAEQRFERLAEQTVGTVTTQLKRYQGVLRASIASIGTTESGGFSTDGWKRYAERFDPLAELPAVRALAIARYVPSEQLPTFIDEIRREHDGFRVYPAHPQPYHLPIVHLGPARVNAKVIGFDLASEEGRRSTVMRAAYLDEAQMTPPIDLHGTDVRALVIAAPFYRGGATPAWQNRKAEFDGALVASIGPDLLLAPLGDKRRRLTWLAIRDGGRLLHDDREPAHLNADPSPMFSRTYETSILGRDLTFEIWTTRAFLDELDPHTPTLVLAAGLLIDGLLFALFVMLTRSNRQAIALAMESTAALREKAARLESTNAELESFAYVVSHDLKTPLRGIHDLATYIEEDLEPVLDGCDEAPTIGYNFGRIYQQVQRANGLIEGILDYSGVGTREERPSSVDTAKLITDIVDTLGVRSEQVRVVGTLPVFETYATRLEQVFANLIGNAFKYHHDRAHATVRVSVRPCDDFYRFSIADDGPGIDHRFHARIFEAFKTLQTQDAIQSSGVGLSIVKKSVELLGGTVSVESTPGNGAVFHFDWPRWIDTVDPERASSHERRHAA